MKTRYPQANDSSYTDTSFISSIATAIQRHELCLHYQPRFDLDDRSATTLEALVRWQRPTIGLLYPETFIKLAEDNALIFQLDLWVFEQCCHDLVWLRDNLNEDIKIAVNFSILSCESVYFCQKIIDLCSQYGLLFSDFIIEITASTNSTDIRKLKSFCETLTNYGASFCLDDFGVGLSPLITLEHLPVHSIKIDRALVANIGISRRSEAIIKHLVPLAHDLGIEVIGEGIEDVVHMDHLRELECEQIQGFYLGRPTDINRLSSDMLVM